MEFDLIARHFVRATPHTRLGPGDDGALLVASRGAELVVTTDMLVAGTHFFPDANPEDLGWKTLAVNLSDLAAMGAMPRWAFLAVSLPRADDAWLAAFAEGFFACAQTFAVDLAGGDVTRGPMNFCVTAIGEVPSGCALRRDGARAGNDIWISGRIGLAALGLEHRKGKLALPESLVPLCEKRLTRPQPRVQLGIALRGVATAAIDVSDGLIADLGHIARRSGLAAVLFRDRFPCLPVLDLPDAPDAALTAFLSGGDDYELCFSAPPACRAALIALATRLDLPLWRVGTLASPDISTPPGAVRLTGPDGEILPCPETSGYEHFT
ncbi:MAG: thiamine-phosphate kinase [Zoogloeaceae bacterium]|jgi:thiamine-monophosphate kinase|nr:thiamine-phosphate kinase [Zoogloeaceae bacterium]